MKNMHKMHKKKQAGFTILEIGIVMIILISLVVTFSTGLWEKQTSSEIGIIQRFFEKDVFQGLGTCRVFRNNVLDGMDRNAFRDCSGLPDNVAGIVWQAPNPITNGLMTITMDLSSMSEHTLVGTSVMANITANDYGHIVLGSSQFADPVLTIQIRAR